MKFLLDTNLLLRLSDPDSPWHSVATQAVERLQEERHELLLVPQVVYEFWVVSTRPIDRNGHGWTLVETDSAVKKWTSAFRLLLDERSIYTRWHALVNAFAVRGKTAHDARLVAAMKKHRIACLLTFNKSDFTRFSIGVFTPQEVIDGTPLT